MKELFESVAAKAAGGLQSAGSKFDFEVLALPGGSFIAVALWCWSLSMMMVKSSNAHHQTKLLTLDAETAEGVELDGTAPTAPSRVVCAWRGAHCT